MLTQQKIQENEPIGSSIFFNIMENFKLTQMQREQHNAPHIPITGLQQLSTHMSLRN